MKKFFDFITKYITMKPFHLFLFLILAGILNAQSTSTLIQATAFSAQQKSAFEENKGQVWDTKGKTAVDVKYHFQQKGIDIFMLPKGLAYQFTKIHYPEGYKVNFKEALSQEEKATQKALRAKIRTETYRMDIELVNANPNASIIADKKSNDYVQYYNRNALNVHSFKKLTYQDVYPGIDWVIYTTENGLKYDFIVQPGADPSLIQLEFKHHEGLKINADGSFTLFSSMGHVTEQAPISFQGEQDVPTAFKLDGDIMSFNLSNYDNTKSLIIDPSLIWASYYGGAYIDNGKACTVDGAGNVYLAGGSESSSNIALGGHQNTTGIYPDAFLAKFNSAGVRIWATYYGGGRGGHTHGFSCAVDGAGNVYLTGDTDSPVDIDFNGHQNTYGGGLGNYEDAFLVKFNSAGVRQWATYYGGDGPDYGYSCAVDGVGNVYLAGRTASNSNIAFGSNTFFGGAYIAKFNSAGVRLWATYYGGNLNAQANSCAVDGTGNVYLAGWTNSNSNVAFGGHQNTFGGNQDAFLVKFNSTGVRQWATYYGGTLLDQGKSCAIDGAGNVYLTGSTASTSNIAFGGHQNTFGGSQDAFIIKFNNVGARQWATYYGGTGSDTGEDCVIDRTGNIYLTGSSTSTSNIAFGGYQNTHQGYFDAFVVKLNDTGVRQWATYYGDNDADYGSACAVDGAGNVYLVGTSEFSSNMASGGHQNIFGGWEDAFIAKLAGSNCSSTNGIDTQIACDSFTWIDGTTYTSSNNSATHTLTNANGCDSVVMLALTINRIDTTTTMTGTIITANATGATYQWLDCANNFSIINDSTGQSFSPSQNGDYAVIITENGCIDTSSCSTIIVVGLNRLTTEDNITIYPNPTTENIQVDFGQIEKEISIKVYSTDGRLVLYKNQIQGALYQLKLPKTTGVYILEIETNKGISHYKVIKE